MLRPIDNLSWSPEEVNTYSTRGKKRMKEESVNGHCSIPEQLKHDHIDDLAEAMRLHVGTTGGYCSQSAASLLCSLVI